MFFYTRSILAQCLFGVVVVTAINLGCSSNTTVTEVEFTREVAASLRQTFPDAIFQIVDELEIQATTTSKDEHVFFLDNAYAIYELDPSEKDKVIAALIASYDEMRTANEVIDIAKIVPILKDRRWLADTKQAMIDRGAEKVPEPFVEDYNSELVVLYAVDSPNNIRFLDAKAVATTKLSKNELIALATKNLVNLLPGIECRGDNGIFMLTAGGNYEASLLLLDSIWNSGQLDVKGEIVVAIPARDLLIVTGSEDQEGLNAMAELVGEMASDTPYRLTQQLFVYRNGHFEVFDSSVP